MRMTHLIPQVNEQFGGTVRAGVDLCNALAAAGHDVSVLTWEIANTPAGWGGPNAPRTTLIGAPASRFLYFTPRQLKLIERRLRESPPGGSQLLHLHGVWDPHLAQLGALARRMKLPYFVTIHGMLDDWCMQQGALKKRAYMRLIGTRWLERAACIHSTAQKELEQSRKWFPKARTMVFPYVLDLTPYRNLPGPDLARARWPKLNNGRPNLLFLSRIHYKKGIEHLFRATALLRDAGRPCNLLVAGKSFPDDYIDQMRALVRDLRLDESVEFVGMVSGADKYSLYEASDLLVIPTSQENFGFVFFEALGCRLPVVTTKGVDVWAELEQSSGAVICEPDPQTLCDRIGDLLADPVRLRAMGVQGRDWTLRFLDEDRIVAKTEEMYSLAF